MRLREAAATSMRLVTAPTPLHDRATVRLGHFRLGFLRCLEIQATLRDIQGLYETLGRVRQFQELQGRGAAERGESMVGGGDGFAGLVTEWERKNTEVTTRVDRLLSPLPTLENGGEEEMVGLRPSRSNCGSLVIISDDDDDPVEVVMDDATQSSAVAPAPMNELPPAAANVSMEEEAPDRLPHSDTQSPTREAPLLVEEGGQITLSSEPDAVNNGSGALAGSPPPINGDIQAGLLPGSTLTAVIGCSTAPASREDVVIGTRDIATFTQTSLKRSEQLYAQEVITADELGELFRHIPKLVSRVDQPSTSRLLVQRAIQTIELANKMVARAKLKTGELVRFVCPFRTALLGCRCRELTTLAGRVDSAALGIIFPSGFVPQELSPLSTDMTWSLLTYVERCDRTRVHDKEAVRSGLTILEKSLCRSWARPLRQAKSTQAAVAPLPLLFLDLSIAIHVTMKLANPKP